MNLLLLAGTAEARALAGRLTGDPRFSITASLSGATRAPIPYAGRVRIGGFGGREGMGKYLFANRIGAILDATHPFARRMPCRTQEICAHHDLPYLRLLRPGWQAGPDDTWYFVDDEPGAADAIAPGARVLLATGRRSLSRFATLAKGRYLIARVIDPPAAPFPYPDGEWLVGRPPFSLEDEIQMFRDCRAEVLVAKNSGGPATAKLAAARVLGLPVVLLRRPAPPPGARVSTIDAAVAWLERLL